MDRGEYFLQRRGYSAAIVHSDILNAIRSGRYGRIAVAYVEWSGLRWQRVAVPWQIIDGRETARAFADALDSAPIVEGRGTSISAALGFSAGLFAANEFTGDRQVIDVSGDGPNNYGPPVTGARDAAVAAGITVNGLPIVIRPSPLFPAIDRYYADCVIGGPGSFVVPVRTPEEFAPAIRQKLVLEIASDPRPRIVPAATHPRVDCLVGERLRARFADPHLPGLD
jgi:hypothetical protein